MQRTRRIVVLSFHLSLGRFLIVIFLYLPGFPKYLLLVFVQVNDAVLVGDHTLVSCSSDTSLKVGHT